MEKLNSLPRTGHYNTNYGHFQTELYAQIRQEAFGEDIGQNSWLTSDEQDRFFDWLDWPQGLAMNQSLHHGFVKPREARHDATLYRLYQKASEKIEKHGGI
jgi:hypothetical protein